MIPTHAYPSGITGRTDCGPAEDSNEVLGVNTRMELAQAYLELGELDRARAYAGLAVDHARRMGTWLQGIRALEVHGMVLARDGHHDLARAAYQEGLDCARTMRFPYGQAAARLRPARTPATRPRRRSREVRPGAGHPRTPGGG